MKVAAQGNGSFMAEEVDNLGHIVERDGIWADCEIPLTPLMLCSMSMKGGEAEDWKTPCEDFDTTHVRYIWAIWA